MANNENSENLGCAPSRCRLHDVTSDPTVVAAYDEPMPASWGDASAPGLSGTVRHNLPEGSIEWTQAALNALHIPPMPPIVDGLEGPATERAVAAFQRRAGLYVDGIAGAMTEAALAKALATSPV